MELILKALKSKTVQFSIALAVLSILQGCVDRNTQHLELMVAKDDWGSEDMTATNAAISAGNGYTAS